MGLNSHPGCSSFGKRLSDPAHTQPLSPNPTFTQIKSKRHDITLDFMSPAVTNPDQAPCTFQSQIRNSGNGPRNLTPQNTEGTGPAGLQWPQGQQWHQLEGEGGEGLPNRIQLGDGRGMAAGTWSCSRATITDIPTGVGITFIPPASGWGAHSRITLLTDSEPRQKE